MFHRSLKQLAAPGTGAFSISWLQALNIPLPTRPIFSRIDALLLFRCPLGIDHSALSVQIWIVDALQTHIEMAWGYTLRTEWMRGFMLD